jgi:hypothetical protein
MKRKTQERVERRSRKRSSSAGSEKMERAGNREGKIVRYCSTGQSPQQAVAPTEEKEEGEKYVRTLNVVCVEFCLAIVMNF